jgi:NAD+ synthase/NAD+ synthase (glutamine-hydrolysing)
MEIPPMRIALGQINTTVGDMAANADRVARYAERAADLGCDMVAFPELAIPGYPPRDLIERPSFVARAERELARLADSTARLPIAIIVGTVAAAHGDSGKQASNIAVVLRQGREVFRQVKMLLPTYDVFDEGRYFLAGDRQVPMGEVGITVCEDAWNDKHYWRHPLYSRDPVEELVAGGAKLLVSINASPYHMGKREQRRGMFQALARRHKIPVVYVNQVGGNDQLVFDGSSFALDAEGEPIATAASFQEDLVVADTERGGGPFHDNRSDEKEAVYEALVLGTRDYLTKCGFKRVLIGLSGGIDSSLTAVVAVDAVGRENVVGVAMPGPFSSDHSVADARAMAERLGIRFEISPITAAYDRVVEGLDRIFGPENKRDVTEENVQARLRGLTLMALSNKWGALVLTTGNKSELAVGYCTLYGDMCGGLAVISDVPKTLVYDLSRIGSRRHGDAIPENVFTKPPSAELRPDQKDTDSLPEYDTLDAILRLYIEEMKPPERIAGELALPLDLVRDIARKVDRNEYKRQQAAPGLKVTTKAFGIGRRFPIAQRYSE